MPKKLEVCFVTEDFYPQFIGGQGIYGFHLVSELSKWGVEMTVIAENKKGRQHFWSHRNINLILTPYVFGNQLLLALVEYLYFLWKLRHVAFNIVHANQVSGLLFVLFKPKNVSAVVISVHTTFYDLYRGSSSPLKKFFYIPLILIEKILYQKADALLFNTHAEEVAVKRYCQIREKKTATIHLGATSVRFSDSEKAAARRKIKKKFRLSKGEKIVLYVGRLVEKKRVATLVKALNMLDAQAANIIGIIIGQGGQREALEKIAAPHVHFLGFVENVKPYFLAADCFVTVSVSEGGMVLTALEAAGFGLPLVLSPDAGSIPILKEGVNGYVADPDDPRDVADKIRRVVQSPHLGRESRKLARFFSWKKCAQETLMFYRSLVQRRPRSA